jgi:uncharacterized protein YjiS (DUF1127 family)
VPPFAARRSPLSVPAWISPLALLRRFIANRRTVHALAGLDDDRLADIGLTRLDVDWACTVPPTLEVAAELDRSVRRRGRTGRREDG